MNVKAFLSQYSDRYEKVRECERKIERIEASMYRAADYSIPSHRSVISDTTQAIALKLAKAQSDLRSTIIEAEEIRQMIADKIEEIKSSELKDLLFARYLLLFPWEAVNDWMSNNRSNRYDTKHVMMYMHRKALKELETVLKYNNDNGGR